MTQLSVTVLALITQVARWCRRRCSPRRPASPFKIFSWVSFTLSIFITKCTFQNQIWEVGIWSTKPPEKYVQGVQVQILLWEITVFVCTFDLKWQCWNMLRVWKFYFPWVLKQLFQNTYVGQKCIIKEVQPFFFEISNFTLLVMQVGCHVYQYSRAFSVPFSQIKISILSVPTSEFCTKMHTGAIVVHFMVKFVYKGQRRRFLLPPSTGRSLMV